MAPHIRIQSAGICCTIQDVGRVGHLRRGVSNSGPMDWLAHALAVKLAGSPSRGTAIEVSIGGLELEVLDGDVHLGLAGGGFRLAIDGAPAEHPARILLRTGQRLAIKTSDTGSWFYVVPSSPIDIAPVLGSFATHARYAIGPGGGKRIAAGDEILLQQADAEPRDYSTTFPHLTSEFPIRVVLGPQDKMFDQHDIDQFFVNRYVLTERMDRMVYVLNGPRLTPPTAFGIVTDPTALGSVQIAGDGYPYILMADRSSTGGYPKIGTIIRADIGRFAQKRPGDTVTFQQTSIEAAVSLLRELKNEIELVDQHKRKGWIDLEALLQGAGNSGVFDAMQADM